jgi:apolipoprotein D and lipocalin family protein
MTTVWVKKINIKVIAALCAFSMLGAIGSIKKELPKLKTVEYIDLERYVGKWYEVARLDQRFQRGCINSTAEYSIKKNKNIKVLNKCTKIKKNGKKKNISSVGNAWVKNKKTNAKLKVQFFLKRLRLNFLAGNYWILEVNEDAQDYEYVVIGEPKRKYFWILARQQKLDETLLNDIITRYTEKGFPLGKLIINGK